MNLIETTQTVPELREKLDAYGIELKAVQVQTIKLGLNGGKGFSPSTVYKTLGGSEQKRFNKEVIEVAQRMIDAIEQMQVAA